MGRGMRRSWALLLLVPVAAATVETGFAAPPSSLVGAMAVALQASRERAAMAARLAAAVEATDARARALAVAISRATGLREERRAAVERYGELAKSTRQRLVELAGELQLAVDTRWRVLRLERDRRLHMGPAAVRTDSRLAALLAASSAALAAADQSLEAQRELQRLVERARAWARSASSMLDAELAALEDERRKLETGRAALARERVEWLRRAAAAGHVGGRLRTLADIAEGLLARGFSAVGTKASKPARWQAAALLPSPSASSPIAVRPSLRSRIWRPARSAPLAAGTGGQRKATGSVALPVDGVPAHLYGDPGAGPLSRGVTLLVHNPRLVRSPWSGRVVFASPFRDFGPLLILDRGDGYHALIAGMDRIDVGLGDEVRAGQAVGRLFATPDDPRRIYVELRRRGEPVDPLPWLAAGQSGEAGSG
ncbi:Murein hydrolase activator EnvC [bacterium HR40]|nr:Murein hydrolase activator EnvC [bacterium HR40]